jgi:hypothetical protein
MGHTVDFQVARFRLWPVGKGFQRDFGSDDTFEFGTPAGDVSDLLPRACKEPVHSRSADSQEMFPDLGIKLKVAVAFQ